MTEIIYVGDGDWIPGVPARNLSEEEYTEHRDAINANEAATGRTLYMVVPPVVIVDEEEDEEELAQTEANE